MAISLLEATKTGQRKRSARLKACAVRVKQSVTSAGASTITGRPPLLPHCRNWTSPSAPRVAEPVEGPRRWMSTMTIGISLPTANEICSL